MRLSIRHDTLGIKPAAKVVMNKYFIFKEKENIADMSGIAVIVQPLQLLDGFLTQIFGLAMHRWSRGAAFFKGIKSAATERPGIINHTGVIFVEKGTFEDIEFFFKSPVFCQGLIKRFLTRFGHSTDTVKNPIPFQRGHVYVAHMGAAKGAASSADGLLNEFARNFFKTPIDF